MATLAIQPRVPRPIHFAHAAGTEWSDDFVRAEPRAGTEGQTKRIIRRSDSVSSKSSPGCWNPFYFFDVGSKR